MRILQPLIVPFKSLHNKLWRRLYLAQTISLLGDAFTWVGIALLAYQLGGSHAASILAFALTLRVTAFIIFSPFAGVMADRLDRKKILYITHIIRTVIVGLLPFVSEVWQVYALIFSLNIFNAFFTPTYQAVIPQVVAQKKQYAAAIGLSNATYQLLGILGPGLAGGFAAWLGVQEVFFVDAATFIIAAVLIFSLPGHLLVNKDKAQKQKVTWKDMTAGSAILFKKKPIRFALLMELAAAIAGAQILVNTVVYIKGTLSLGNAQYGWAMAAFGLGATVAALLVSNLSRLFNYRYILLSGAVLLVLAILPANFAPLPLLLILWLIAGVGQSLVEIPAQTMIAEQVPLQQQGKVYGAHFAWSHLWWAFAYPLAGLLGNKLMDKTFLYGGVCTAIILVVIIFTFRKTTVQYENHVKNSIRK